MNKKNLKTMVKEVLKNGYLMSLGTFDSGGVWVADVIYIYDEDLNIYWMSHPSVRHSKAILKNELVSGTITISSQGQNNSGVQFSGVAKRIKGPRVDLSVKHLSKRKKPVPKPIKDILIDGESWYIIKPKKFEIINEKAFGFNKKILKM